MTTARKPFIELPLKVVYGEKKNFSNNQLKQLKNEDTVQCEVVGDNQE